MRAAVDAIKLPLIRLRANSIRVLKPSSRGTGRDRLILLDPGLAAFSGHHFEWNHFMRRELRGHFDVRVYANIRAGSRVISLLDACPIFEDGTYPEYRGRDFRSVHRAMTRGMIDSLRKIDPSDLSSRNAAVMHTLTVFQLSGIAEWYLGLPADQRPKLLLHLQFPLDFLVHPRTEVSHATTLARQATRTLASIGSVVFSCNSVSLAHVLNKQLGIDCAVLPFPLNWPEHFHSQPLPLASGPIFGFFGGMRLEKGAGLLADAIPQFLAQFPDTRFILHAPLRESDPVVVKRLECLPHVQLLRRNFETKDAYFAEFCRAACILLPYDPSAYRHRTSSILVEALATRRLVITTKGTWMEMELRRRGCDGLLMSEFTPESLVHCLSKAHGDLLEASHNNSKIDPDIIAANNPAAFCSAISALLRDAA